MWRIIEEGVLFDGRAVLGISGAGQLLALGHLLYASLWICNYWHRDGKTREEIKSVLALTVKLKASPVLPLP